MTRADRGARVPTSVWRCTVALVAAGALAGGCRSLGKRGPTAESVASCRQLTQQGMNATDRGDWKRAESLLRRATEACPVDADARRQYGEALWHRGARTDALAQLEEARRLSGDDAELAVRTGELYLALNRPDDARRMVEEAMRIDPRFAPGWALRGRISSAAGQTRQALAEYQRSLGYAPDSVDVAILIAETYRQLNEPDRALLALQSAAENFSPGDEPQQLLHLEGLALAALDRHDDAARVLSRAARRERPSAEILYRLAEAEWRAGRAANARATAQEALSLDPNHVACRALAAQLSATASRERSTR
jgi:protein O-GlcNAc transferase